MNDLEKEKLLEECMARLAGEKYTSIKNKMREYYTANPQEDITIDHYIRYGSNDIIFLSAKGLELIGKLKIPFEDFIDFLKIVIITCGEFNE